MMATSTLRIDPDRLARLASCDQFQEVVDQQSSVIKPIFAAANAITSYTRTTQNRGFAVLPGVISDDPRTLATLRDLSLDLNERLPVDRDERGIMGPTGVSSSFLGMNTVSGHYMDPMTIPPMMNEALRESMGLFDDPRSRRHDRIFEAVANLMLERAVPASLHIRREASSCFGKFTTKPEEKLHLYEKTAANIDRIAGLVHKGQTSTALADYGFLNAYYVGVRSQTDKVSIEQDRLVSKAREVNDLLYAITGGRAGDRFVADKTVYDKSGKPIPEVFARRRRTVYGYTGGLNYVMTAIMNLFRGHYLHEYAFTWKHRGNDDVKEKASCFSYAVGVDVKEHDQASSRAILFRFINKICDKVSPAMADMIRAAFSAPIYVPNPYVGHGGGVFLGDPFDPQTWNIWPGLPSGIAFNPDCGKFQMTAIYLCIIDDYFGDVLEFGIDRILKGEHPLYALLDMSDDGVFLTNSSEFQEWLLGRLKADERVSPYMKLEFEASVTFLGGVFMTNDLGQFDIQPNVTSYLLNWFNHERPITSPRRAYWNVGWREREAIFSHAASFKTVHSAMEDHFRAHFGTTPQSIVESYEQHERLPDIELLSYADRMALIKPSTLSYLISPDELSPALREKLVSTIDAGVVLTQIDRYLSPEVRAQLAEAA